MFISLTPGFSVAGQIGAADVARAAEAGFATIVNNRPEGETIDQTPGSMIEAAARDAGLGYAAIPVSPGGFSMPQVEAMAAQLDAAAGPVLAYCRSGTRSTMLWALAQAHRGEDPEALAAAAAAGGYDVSPLMPTLRQLSGR